jgi:hypothetical protein
VVRSGLESREAAMIKRFQRWVNSTLFMNPVEQLGLGVVLVILGVTFYMLVSWS